MSMRKSLQEWGEWGNQLIGEARTQVAPVLQQAADQSSTYLKSGADSLLKGVSNVKFLTGLAGSTHTFEDPQSGNPITVAEVNILAEGGFGSVLRVRDTTTGEEYALKKIACQEGVQIASTAEDALKEAKVLSSLPPYPHIIRCFGFSSEACGPGSTLVKILLELCCRGHLLDYMDQLDGRLSVTQILTPFAQVAAAVRHLHALQPPLQHRDLKAENILRCDDKVWKLCDFGSCSTQKVPAKDLPRAQAQNLQEEIDKTVTLLYRPPEMADVSMNGRKGIEIGEAVDLWMLGCVFYTLVFYKHPFQDNPTVLAISNAKYFIPRDHPNAKNAKLSCIAHWLLSANPRDRPTAARLCEVLRDWPHLDSAKMQEMVPPSVNEKMKRLAELYDTRNCNDLLDSGGLLVSPEAVNAVLKGTSGSEPATNPRRPAKVVSEPPSAGASSALVQDEPRTRQGGGGREDSTSMLDLANFTATAEEAVSQPMEFDIASALAPQPVEAAAPAGAGTKQTPAVSSTNEPQRQTRNRARTTPAPAEQDNLLDFDAPATPPAPHRHASSPACFDDLLGDFDQPAQASLPSAGVAAPQGVTPMADFADFMSAPGPSPGPVQQPQALDILGESPDLLGNSKPQPAPPGQPGGNNGSAGGGSFWADFGHLAT